VSFRGVMYRFADARVSAAAANVTAERFIDIGVGGIWIGCQERGSGHNHSGLAVAALGNLVFEPRALDGMLSVGGKPLDGGDFAITDYGDSRHTRAGRFTIDVNGARAT
jgi:hypothetical protein